MGYQLGLWQIIAANFSANNPIMSVILLFVRVGLPIFFYITLRNHRIERNIVVTICILSTVGFNIYPIYGNGWKITDNRLSMNAYGSSATMNITDMKIDMVGAESEWMPTRRNIGSGMPNLLVGRCTMDNGKKALVFYYQNPERMLLIEAKQKYYIIAYPGMMALYNDLVRLGAKEGKF